MTITQTHPGWLMWLVIILAVTIILTFIVSRWLK